MSAYKSSIYDLLSMDNLAIPDYQRPYKWTKRNINELLTDISKAIEEGQKYGDSYKYRIGTILIHNSQDGKSYIVDGQQRILSIALVCLYLFPSFRSDLTNHCFTDDVSKQNIRDNYMFIQQWFTLQSDEEKNRFLEALKRIIEVIVITVNEESEAFQLFDSHRPTRHQNGNSVTIARGDNKVRHSTMTLQARQRGQQARHFRQGNVRRTMRQAEEKGAGHKQASPPYDFVAP